MVEFFANHEIDAPIFAQDILAIGYDSPLDESGATNEVNDHDDGNQPAYDLKEDDDALSIESEDVEINYNHSDRDANKEDNEDESDDSDGYNDGNDIPIERKEPIRFNVDNQRPYFSLGMTLSNAFAVRESISWYAISR